jgi:hypothetical protein
MKAGANIGCSGLTVLLRFVQLAAVVACLTNMVRAATIPASDVSCGPVPDARRLAALSMLESGDDDRAVGPRGEVSRYQISPALWKAYTDSREYRDPAVSSPVALQHWSRLYNYYLARTARPPDDFDMYVLWNTRAGYYAKYGFNPQRVHATVRDHAQRFVNLVNRPQ